MGEGKNRTVNQSTTRMRIHTGLLASFMDKRINIIAYSNNCGPPIQIDQSLNKEWSGKDIDLSHSRVFSGLADVQTQNKSTLYKNSQTYTKPLKLLLQTVDICTLIIT